MVKQWKKSLDGDDVQAEAEDALEKDISQMSPASNSVAGNLDGGIAAVDWSSKTTNEVSFNQDVFDGSNGFKEAVSVTGSGYITDIWHGFTSTTPNPLYLALNIDGAEQYKIPVESGGSYVQRSDNPWQGTVQGGIAVWMRFNTFFRFDSSFAIGMRTQNGSPSDFAATAGKVDYVLD